MTESTEFDLPRSEEVMRALVDAFDLRAYEGGEAFRTPTGRRWLEGGVFDETKRAEFQGAFLQTFVSSGVLSLPPEMTVEGGAGPEFAWAVQLSCELTGWDVLVGHVNALPNLDGISHANGCAAVLRLVAISLALREAAWWRLGGCRREGMHPLQRAFRSPGAGPLLKGWFEEAALRVSSADPAQQLTRDAFATAMRVAPGVLDSWLDGRNCPNPASQRRLAQEFEKELGRSADELVHELRLHIGLSRLLARLEAVISRPLLAGIAEQYVSLVPRLVEFMERVGEDLAREVDAFGLFLLLVAGQDAPYAAVLELAAMEESNPLWKQLYRDVRLPWHELLSNGIAGLPDKQGLTATLIAHGTPPEVARQLIVMMDVLMQVGMADEILEAVVRDLAPEQREFESMLRELWRDSPLFELLRVMYDLRQGDPQCAFARLNRLAEALPPVPEQFVLLMQCALLVGAVDAAEQLGMLAFEAVGPSPELDLERAKVALMRWNPERAITLLEPAAMARPEHVDTLYSLAVAFARAGRDEEAQRWCDAVLARTPWHADALKLAANLHASAGHKRDAGKFESRARALGHPSRTSGLDLLVERAVRLLAITARKGARDD